VGLRAVLETVEKRKIPSLRREWNPRTPNVQPVDYATYLYADVCVCVCVCSLQSVSFQCK